jgi:uncharacterized protein involved in outer membrane biogenesis
MPFRLPSDTMIDKSTALTVLHSANTKKYGLRLVATVLAIGVLGFLALPPLLKWWVVGQLGEALHRPVSVERIAINPYALTLQIDGLAIQEKGGGETVAGFDSLYANLQASSLFRGGPVLSEIRLEGPKFRIVRLADNRYNFSDLIDESMAKPAADTEASTPAFSLNNIQITQGLLEFDDRPLGVIHRVDAIGLSLPFVSSMAYATETFVEPAFSARINGAELLLKGKSKPFADSLESEFVLELDNLQLAKYLGYLPFPLPIKVASGAVDSDLKLVFRQEKERPATLNLSGTAAVKELAVHEASGDPLLTLKRLDLAVGSAELLSRKFAIDRLSIDSPEIHARVDAQGGINWLALLPKAATGAEFAEKSAAKPALKSTEKSTSKAVPKALASSSPIWSLGEAKISAGAFRWLDESHGKPFHARVDTFNFDLKKLDGQGATPAEFDVSWRVAADEWLKVESFSAKGGRLDLAKHELSLGEVLAKGVRIMMRRAADGSLDWVKPPSLRAAQTLQQDSQQKTETSSAWKLHVARYAGEDVGLRFEDAAVSPASTQTIEGLGFELENLSSEPGQTIKLATRFKLNRKGQVEVGGTLKLFPLDADLTLDLKTVELLPLQPYFGEKLNIALKRGQLALDGHLKLRQDESVGSDGWVGGFSGRTTIGDFLSVDKANADDLLKWKSLYFGHVDVHHSPDSVSVGEVALTDFFARVIINPQGQVNLSQIVRQEAPPAALAGEKAGAASASSATSTTVSADGKASVPVASVAEASKAVLPVKIGKVTLQGGSVRFTDNFVKPNYSAHLKQLGGRITGLSSDAQSTAEVDLRGSYDNVAPLSITGRINPLAAKPVLDVQAEIKSVEMTSLSPYSGKYAGYAIDKGKLSLFVKYKIENNQLEAENRVFIDQLTFGEPVDSPDATKLPVMLAVSLLKNRNGEIDINLPISGSLDDPQFSVGGLIVQVIINLLGKAITSPFALLGLASGGDGELSSIDFDDGRNSIAPPALQRLEKLATALLDRPALKLEIEGRTDRERDREGLKRVRIERKVRALKLEDMASAASAPNTNNAANTSNGVAGSGVDATQAVSEQEYPALLERVYRAEKFPKPRNLVGMVKTLPVAEMEKLMLTHSVVDDDDLRALAERRAKAVRDWLIGKEVLAERIFLLPAKLEETDASAGVAEKARPARANFSLK